jgi:hypothetical protein
MPARKDSEKAFRSSSETPRALSPLALRARFIQVDLTVSSCPRRARASLKSLLKAATSAVEATSPAISRSQPLASAPSGKPTNSSRSWSLPKAREDVALDVFEAAGFELCAGHRVPSVYRA